MSYTIGKVRKSADSLARLHDNLMQHFQVKANKRQAEKGRSFKGPVIIYDLGGDRVQTNFSGKFFRCPLSAPH